jgi:hypothetical protein
MELSPSWEAKGHSAVQECTSDLWDQKVCYRVHKSSLLDPILTQFHPVSVYYVSSPSPPARHACPEEQVAGSSETTSDSRTAKTTLDSQRCAILPHVTQSIDIVTCSGFVTTSEHQMWRVGVLETPFGLLLSFTYDFTSRHYNYFYNVRSSLPCWFFILVGPLIAGFLVAALILGLSDLTLRLWSAPFDLLWCWVSDLPWFLCPDVASLIGSFNLLLFYSLPPWNRVLALRIEDTLLKGNFFSVVQVVTGTTSVNIRCSDNNCLPSRCLGIATIRLSNVTCIWEPLRRKHHIRHNIIIVVCLKNHWDYVILGYWRRSLRHHQKVIGFTYPNVMITKFAVPEISLYTKDFSSLRFTRGMAHTQGRFNK